jgi:hypothetical protein
MWRPAGAIPQAFLFARALLVANLSLAFWHEHPLNPAAFQSANERETPMKTSLKILSALAISSVMFAGAASAHWHHWHPHWHHWHHWHHW